MKNHSIDKVGINLNTLFLEEGAKSTSYKTENYLLDTDHQLRKKINKFSEKYFNLTPLEIFELQNKIEKLHGEHEMNFLVKNQNDSYQDTVTVPFCGFAPIDKKIIDENIKSTRPVLQKVRELLQVVFSEEKIEKVFDKHPNFPEEKKKLFCQIIKENPYYETGYIHKNFKSYPFLSLVGFDAAIEKLDESKNTFFEFNAGTPCGIEDQYQLFEHFKNNFKDLYSKISPMLENDRSHKLLRETIEDNAESWTGNKKGISVIISPGIYNPAHPEIAALSRNSGMPLVALEDLYIDQNGDVRLLTKNKHPIVTGIYNRKEESFLLYSKKFKIPLRSSINPNERLAKKLNLKLDPAILYSYLYDENSTPFEIERDQKTGEPLFQELFGQLSVDPATSIQGDLIEAVWNKKLYISNIGGRIFDDKRLFRLITEYMIAEKNIAHPPAGLGLDQLEKNIDDVVIKVPNKSGGVGVYIGKQLSAEKKQELIKKVNNDPSNFEVQNLVKLAVIPSVYKRKDKLEFTTLPVDWRLIIFIDSEGEVKYSSHSCLVRTAPKGQIITNTSSGGGYALGLIYSENLVDKSTWSSPEILHIPIGRLEQFSAFLENMESLCQGESSLLEGDFLTYQFRSIMDFIPFENINWFKNFRLLQKGEIKHEDFKKSLDQFKKDISSKLPSELQKFLK